MWKTNISCLSNHFWRFLKALLMSFDDLVCVWLQHVILRIFWYSIVYSWMRYWENANIERNKLSPDIWIKDGATCANTYLTLNAWSLQKQPQSKNKFISAGWWYWTRGWFVFVFLFVFEFVFVFVFWIRGWSGPAGWHSWGIQHPVPFFFAQLPCDGEDYV